MSWRWAWGSPVALLSCSHFAGSNLPTPNTLIILHEVPTLKVFTPHFPLARLGMGKVLLSAGGVMGISVQRARMPEVRVAGHKLGSLSLPWEQKIFPHSLKNNFGLLV